MPKSAPKPAAPAVTAAAVQAAITAHGGLGAQIRDLRKAKRMTLQAMAGAIGRSVGYVSQLERDLSRLDIETLHAIADVSLEGSRPITDEPYTAALEPCGIAVVHAGATRA